MINKESWYKFSEEIGKIGLVNIIFFNLTKRTRDDIWNYLESRITPVSDSPRIFDGYNANTMSLFDKPTFYDEEVKDGEVVVVRREDEKEIHETIILSRKATM